MKRLLLFLFLITAARAQNTAKFPGAVPTTADLGVASNRAETTLTTGVNATATSIPVASSSGFKANSFATIDSEIVAICSIPDGNHLNVGKSSCPNVDGRGIDTANGGGAAASHLASAKVQGRIVAWNHNQAAAEIRAMAGRIYGTAVNVKEAPYSATGDGTTDDSAAIQAAIDSGASEIFIPAGQYKLTTALNLTNRAYLHPIIVRGAGCGLVPGSTLSVLKGATGGVVIDTTGSANVTLKDFCITGTTSTIGILVGRSAAGQFADGDIFESMVINMPSIPAATSRGTIGIYNSDGESFIYRNLNIYADLPLALGAGNPLSISSPFQGALTGPVSMSNLLLERVTMMPRTWSGMELWAVSGMTCIQCFTQRQTGNTTDYAFTMTSSSDSLAWDGGQIEIFPGVLDVKDYLDHLRVKMKTLVSSIPYIRITAGKSITGADLEIRAPTTGIQSLTAAGAGAAIRNSRIALMDTQGWTDANLTLSSSIVTVSSNASNLTLDAASNYVLVRDASSRYVGPAFFTADVNVGGVHSVTGNAKFNAHLCVGCAVGAAFDQVFQVARFGGTGANAPLNLAKANLYGQFGDLEYNTNSYRGLGFGFNGPANTYTPAVMGFQEISSSGQTFGDLIFATRYSNSDVTPVVRLRVRANGTVNYTPYTYANLPTGASGQNLTAGDVVFCSNCTTAATCAAGGTGHLAVYNGAAWTCQ